MQDNAKNAVTVVQSVRNVIMGSTLMATTAILFCTGVAAVLSSTYTIKKPLSDTVFGAHGEYMMALKYVALMLLFLFAFLCHSLAICFLNQASFLINTSGCLFSSADADSDSDGRRRKSCHRVPPTAATSTRSCMAKRRRRLLAMAR